MPSPSDADPTGSAGGLSADGAFPPALPGSAERAETGGTVETCGMVPWPGERLDATLREVDASCHRAVDELNRVIAPARVLVARQLPAPPATPPEITQIGPVDNADSHPKGPYRAGHE